MRQTEVYPEHNLLIRFSRGGRVCGSVIKVTLQRRLRYEEL